MSADALLNVKTIVCSDAREVVMLLVVALAMERAQPSVLIIAWEIYMRHPVLGHASEHVLKIVIKLARITAIREQKTTIFDTWII